MRVRDILGLQARYAQEQPSPAFCLPSCKIGLEFEWERCRNYLVALEHDSLGTAAVPSHIAEVQKFFNVHADGSLRNHGTEFTFNGGYSGTKILSAVNAMDECSRIMKFEGSYRTSMHVHMDMQDMVFPDDVFSLGAVYCLAEPFLYDFVGNDRDCCNYCVPWYAHPGHFEQYFKALKSPGAKGTQIPNVLKNSKAFKYSGLNFFSLGDFGTLEFRHAPVTMQKAQIVVWINLIMRLKKWALENRGLTGEALISRAHQMGPEAFLTALFQEDYREAVKRTRDLKSTFKLGLTTLYYFVSISQ